jgi:hypothetical protein
MIKKRWGESILLFFVANLILHNLYAILKKIDIEKMRNNNE